MRKEARERILREISKWVVLETGFSNQISLEVPVAAMMLPFQCMLFYWHLFICPRIVIYDRGTEKVYRIFMGGIVCALWLIGAI
ncbi:cystinosin-like protein [Corchorus olitorius]|uniref:Cystinosin-like protein n=1 Tax=Corchorus olitorius TaxID=93759 RepID=A0A1R3I4C2_9ROSI|nr:cystinosin-like protein [Corchorus olitorius]